MKVIIDFTGYYSHSNFIIKEFCRCNVYLRKIKTDKIIITKHPTTDLSPRKNEYDYFYNKYGIKKFVGHSTLSSLRDYIKSIFRQKTFQNSIYVRDYEKIELLNNFMGQNFDNNIKCLRDLGFDAEEIVTTTCKYHDRIYSYCAHDNALVMANWLMEKNSFMVQSPKDIVYIVTDFAGHRDKSHKFVIKELSICGLDIDGKIVYQKLCVFKSYGRYEKLQDVERINFDNYYDTYGIKWLAGTQVLGKFKTNICKMLNNLGVKYIYVRNFDKKHTLATVIGDTFDIVCLDEYNYVEGIEERSNCGYHTHEDTDKNICIHDSVKSMVNWILEKKIFDSKERTFEEVDCPALYYQQFENNYSDYISSFDGNQNVFRTPLVLENI